MVQRPTRKAHGRNDSVMSISELNMQVFLNRMTKSKAIEYLIDNYSYRREFARWLVFIHWGRQQ